jgi:hypothetical protein
MDFKAANFVFGSTSTDYITTNKDCYSDIVNKGRIFQSN